MIKTVIFDMDGVIVDTEPIHHYAYFEQFKELGITVSEELYRSFTGFSTKNTFEKLKKIFSIEQDIESLIQRKRSIFNDAFDNKNNLYLLDGVENLIQELYSNKIELIVASSASKVTINRVFNRFKLHQYFSHIVSGEDFLKSKPHPAIFEHAVSISVANKENCIVIEDSTNGVLASKQAGIYCIGYLSKNSKNQDLTLANKVIEHFDELNYEIIRHIYSVNKTI